MHDSTWTRPGPLIAVDLDGTLLGPDNSVSAENMAALQQAERSGAVIVIITGRPHLSAEAVARSLNLPRMPLVSFNGAQIRWTGGGPVLHSCTLPADVAAELVEQCLGDRLHLHYYLDDTLYVSQDNELARQYCRRIGIGCREQPDMRQFAGSKPLKLLVVDDPAAIPQLLDRYRATWGDRVYITRSMAEYLEFLSPQVSKGLALDWLMSFLGIRREDTLAIGDSMNDLPLLAHAGSAVAMPDADPELKAMADFVPHDAASGVAEAIDWFFRERGRRG